MKTSSFIFLFIFLSNINAKEVSCSELKDLVTVKMDSTVEVLKSVLGRGEISKKDCKTMGKSFFKKAKSNDIINFAHNNYSSVEPGECEYYSGYDCRTTSYGSTNCRPYTRYRCEPDYRDYSSDYETFENFVKLARETDLDRKYVCSFLFLRKKMKMRKKYRVRIQSVLEKFEKEFIDIKSEILNICK